MSERLAVQIRNALGDFNDNNKPVTILVSNLVRNLAEAQAKIDSLMLEYCSEEMTEEQMQRWANNQRLLTEEEQAAVEAAIERKCDHEFVGATCAKCGKTLYDF